MEDFESLLYNPKFLYSNSQEFFKIGIFSANDFFYKVSITPQGNKNIIKYVSVPAVNISFALELALKGLHLQVFKTHPKGHSLLKLFSELPENIIARIQKQKAHKKYEHFNIVEISRSDNKHIPFNKGLCYINGSMGEVLSNLKLQDNSFCDFRYMFEMGTKGKPFYYNFLFMANITHNSLNTLYEIIKNKK